MTPEMVLRESTDPAERKAAMLRLRSAGVSTFEIAEWAREPWTSVDRVIKRAARGDRSWWSWKVHQVMGRRH